MAHWKKTFVRPQATIADAFANLEKTTLQICLVVDEHERLLGTVTDGDIRRGILRKLPLDAPVTDVMKNDPLVAHPDQDREALLRIMRSTLVRQLPVVGAERVVLGLVLLDELLETVKPRDNWVVLMAGGFGNRLMPLTKAKPKPLLKVGEKPILETILESFVEHDFRRFYISVNYKADMVKRHFGSGEHWGVEIRYLDEDRKLGTAGALGLIKEIPEQPLVVMNGDVLTRINFSNLMDFHDETGAKATMCVREYDFQIPYGVVKTNYYRIVGIKEKPVCRFYVNGGIYVVDPDILNFVSEDEVVDMPDLFNRIIDAGHETAVFPIQEYWLDIGQPDNLQKANWDFPTVFDSAGEDPE